MIFDSFEHISRYFSAAEGVEAAANAMKNYSKENFPLGKITVEGEQVFLNLQAYETAPRNVRQMEVHEKYMDIFYLVEGQEVVLVKSVDRLTCITHPYCPETEAAFGPQDGDEASLVLREGDFVILFPGEAHASGIAVDGCGAVKKIVGKVRIN